MIDTNLKVAHELMKLNETMDDLLEMGPTEKFVGASPSKADVERAYKELRKLVEFARHSASTLERILAENGNLLPESMRLRIENMRIDTLKMIGEDKLVEA